jgi:hypothetical protein
VLHSSEVDRLRRELRELRATCAAGRRRLNSTEERLLESSLDSVEGLSGQLAAQRHEGAQLRQARALTLTLIPALTLALALALALILALALALTLTLNP